MSARELIARGHVAQCRVPGCGWEHRGGGLFHEVDELLERHLLEAHTARELAGLLASFWRVQGEKRPELRPIRLVTDTRSEKRASSRNKPVPRERKHTREGSASDIVLKALRDAPGRTLRTSDLLDLVEQSGRVRGAGSFALNWLKKKGLVERVSNGVWRLVE